MRGWKMWSLVTWVSLAACDTETSDKSDPDLDGDGFVEDDCAEGEATIFPGAEEYCDGVDNNCDGVVDEDSAVDAQTWFVDADGDGFGGTETTTACEASAGLATDSTDCADTNPAINPGVDEVCDGVDNNCDDEIDNNAIDGEIWYPDKDGDGYGDADNPTIACVRPPDYIKDGSDCDDSSAAAKPGATEVCDGVDNNCDGEVDEDSAEDALNWYADTDGDGLGDRDDVLVACNQPSGYVLDDSDCDDTDAKTMSCYCSLDAVGSATYITSSGSIYGAWMADPLETLGSGRHWEMDSYTGSSVVEYPSLTDLSARTNATTISLGESFEGTGAVVYDGYLYYIRYYSNTIVKFDLSTRTAVDTLTISSAGYNNTYHYQWGGWSDMDLAVDENGLWVIYATSANSGRLVLSKIDEKTFSVEETWNTSSTSKTSIGNAFVICGVLYATNSYSSSGASINFAFDTESSTSWDPGISMPVTYGYVTQIDYNPTDGKLYVWDYQRRVTFQTTTSR